MSKCRENYIDIARGLAIISIVVYHVETAFYPALTLLVRAYLVPIFFVLSGYLLNTNTSAIKIIKKYYFIG